MMRVPITAPPAMPPAYGLVRVAPTLDSAELERLLGAGWSFQPETCGDARGGVLELDCGGTGAQNAERGPEVVDGDAFVIYAWDQCSTFGFQARDWTGRAQRMLRASESYWLARELWDGALGLAQGSLKSLADVVSSGPTDVVEAIGLVEGGLADLLRGSPGMIHMTVQALTHAMAAYAIYRDGALWRTASGNIVVADAGYSGDGPNVAAGDSQWLYGSPVVQVALGAIEVTPRTFQDAQDQAMATDQSVNTVTIYAARPATFTWDACGTLAAELDLATPLIGGVS